jgi:hypothetical protein
MLTRLLRKIDFHSEYTHRCLRGQSKAHFQEIQEVDFLLRVNKLSRLSALARALSARSLPFCRFSTATPPPLGLLGNDSRFRTHSVSFAADLPFAPNLPFQRPVKAAPAEITITFDTSKQH